MVDIVISICIPTYNRDKYLRCLLVDLTENISALKHSYEIVISDNASTDSTESVVHDFMDKMNMRYLKRDKNYGGLDNWLYLKWQAKGIFQVYLADDDGLIVPELSNIIDKMLVDPEVGIVYGPWYEHNRVTGENKFLYTLDYDVLIEKGDHMKMLELILERHIFPEMFVVRTELVRHVSPFANPHAYWAFVHAAEYLAYTKVLFTSKPYYLSINLYFEDEPASRDRMGWLEMQEAWDRYRGGVEYVLSRTQVEKLGTDEFYPILMNMQKFVAIKLSVAIVARMSSGRDPIDTYYLACRLKSMGFQTAVIHRYFETIRYQAMAHYLLHDPILNQDIDKIICIGDIDEGLMKALQGVSHLPIYADRPFRPTEDAYKKAIVLMEGSVFNLAVDKALIKAKSLHLIGVSDLMQKFY